MISCPCSEHLGLRLEFILANASFFIKSMPGPGRSLTHRPIFIANVVGLQIIMIAVLVGLFS
jgi:hypothetical protein